MKRNIFVWIFLLLSHLSAYSQAKYDHRDSLLLGQSDSLFALGVKNYHQGKYQEAIPLFAESEKIDLSVLDSTSNRHDYATLWLASCYYKLGNPERAKSIHKYCNLPPVDRRLTIASDSLGMLGSKALAEGHLYAGLYYYTQAAELEKNTLGSSHVFYANTLTIISMLHSFIGDSELNANNMYYSDWKYREAIDAAQKALAVYEPILEPDAPDINCAKRLIKDNEEKTNKEDNVQGMARTQEYDQKCEVEQYYKIAIDLLSINNTEEAIPLLKHYRELQEPNSKKYWEASALIGTALINIAKYDEAINYLTVYKNLFENFMPHKGKEYANICGLLGMYYAQKGQYQKAVPLLDSACAVYESDSLSMDITYAKLLNIAIDAHDDIGDYKGARDLSEKAIPIYKGIYGENSDEYLELTESKLLADEFLDGNLKQIYDKMMQLNRYDNLSKDTASIALLLTQISGAIVNSEPTMVLDLIDQAIELCQKMFGKDNDLYAVLLILKAENLSELNANNKVAIEYALEAMDILERICPVNDPNYIQVMLKTANLLLNTGDMNYLGLAVKLSMTACIRAEQYLGEKSIIYANALRLQSKTCWISANYQLAVEKLEQVLQIYKELAGKTYLGYIDAFATLSYYKYALNHELSETISEMEESISFMKRHWGDRHEEYQYYLRNITAYCMLEGYYDKASDYACQAVQGCKDLAFHVFPSLTSSERENYWSQFENFIQSTLPDLCLKRPNDKQLVKSVYDAQLLSKGLLLSAGIELRTLLLESCNQQTIQIYDSLTVLNKKISNAYSKEVMSKDSVTLQNWNRQAENLERKIMTLSKTYGDYTANLRINWEDVRNKLKKNEMAVEYILAPTDSTGRQYAALILRNDSQYPQLVNIGSESEFDAISEKDYYETTELYNKLWSKILASANGIERIYFSPIGILYNIAIEYVHDTDSTFIGDKYKMFRLSSTRQIVTNRVSYANKKVVLYGGMTYDTDVSDIASDERLYTDNSRVFSTPVIVDSLSIRGAVNYLPGTKEEVIEIKNIFDENEYSKTTALFTGIQGSEASFKSLSGKKTNIIHIATHGFYFTEKETVKNRRLAFVQTDNMALKREDKALTRSGLLFSGADLTLKGQHPTELKQDGILTAQELSLLDLRGLNLVVLSACKTGLGDISGEGVFGLQRGFKKAGAQTLLMSLWDVDDDATRLLMIQFYRNLLNGFPVSEALRLAQEYLREYEVTITVNSDRQGKLLSVARMQNHNKENVTIKKIKKYQSPYYWAAFILLDAFE